MFEESRKCHRAALRGQSAHRTKHTITETGKKYPGDTANIHCARYTHVSHTHSLPKGKKHREANMYKQHTHTQSITMKPLMGGPRVGTLTAVVH